MLSNPLETLSDCKHREQQCQPHHVLPLTDPLPFHRHTELSLTSQHRNANTALMAKTLRASPGKQIQPCLKPPDVTKSATVHYMCCCLELYSLTLACTPPALWLKHRLKGVGLFSVISGAAELTLAGGMLETLLT